MGQRESSRVCGVLDNLHVLQCVNSFYHALSRKMGMGMVWDGMEKGKEKFFVCVVVYIALQYIVLHLHLHFRRH